MTQKRFYEPQKVAFESLWGSTCHFKSLFFTKSRRSLFVVSVESNELFSHFGSVAGHGETPLKQILSEFHTALESMQKATPGSLILGAADCNTQLLPMPEHVGPRTGTNDQDSADLIAHVLASVGLTVPSSYADLGPTRFPWDRQNTHQKPSVIDYLFANPKLITQMHTTNLPTPDANTDHTPLGMTAHAPYASRRDRRQQFEAQQTNAAYWKDRVTTRWEPSTLSGLRNHLKNTRFSHLDQVAPQLTQASFPQK